ncbi:MAG: transglycosylase SLT domain-containing protein [Calditrichaeota bacterium]|nr:transglycosylase SLT domain-containing protein [Calditrichota bacterium]
MKNKLYIQHILCFLFLLFFFGCASTTPKQAYKVSEQTRISEIGQKSQLEFLEVGRYEAPISKTLLTKAEPFIPIVRDVCKDLNIDIAITMAVIERESGFNPDNENKSDPSYGLMQLVPESGGRSANRYLFSKDEAPTPSYLYNPTNNIYLGVGYLSMMKNYYYGNVKDSQSRQMCMIGGYNAGPGGVARSFGVRSVDAAVKEINKLSSVDVYKELINNLPKSDTYNAREYLQKIYDTVPKWTFLRFSDSNFYTRIEEIRDPGERIALCREYIKNSGNVDLLCAAQDVWASHDRAGAFEHFRNEYAGNPGKVTSMFLLGRLLDDPIRRIEYSHDIIWFNDKMTLGYRLLIETYVKFLFENGATGEVRNELQRLVRLDRKHFKKLTYLLPREEYPSEWLYRLQMFTEDYNDARTTLKRARKRGADWVSHENVIQANLMAGRYKDVLKEIKLNIEKRITSKALKLKNKDWQIRKEYTKVLRSIGAYKPILKFLERYEKQDRTTEVLLELAKYYALSGRHEKALQNLFWALEDLKTAHINNQSCYWKRLDTIDDFWVLYTDTRWVEVLELEAEVLR